MPGYDSTLFVEIVIGEGAADLGLAEVNGEVFQHLQGLNGKRVTICISDENTGTITLKMYLIDLGMEQLIPILFPENNV